MYRAIDTSTWDDPKIKQLEPEQKLLFFYLITNRHAHMSGIYILPSTYMAHECGLHEEAVLKALRALESLDFIARDVERDVVWVRRMFHYQRSTSKHDISAARHLKSLHSSPLIEDFLVAYTKVAECAESQLARAPRPSSLDRPSKGNPGVAECHSVGNPELALGEGEGQVQEQDQEEEKASGPAGPSVSDWIEVWNRNRGRLPAVRSQNVARRRTIRAALKEEPDLDRWARAIRLKAADPFWQRKRYGADTLLRPSKRAGYLDAADDPLTGSRHAEMDAVAGGEDCREL